jgi:diguanylate cyclase (GGDEF)-like protein
MRLRPGRLRPEFGLVGKFALVSVLPIVALGFVLAYVLGADVRQRALADARRSAALLEQSLVLPQLAPSDLRGRLSTGKIQRLDQALRPAVESQSIARIKVWDPRGRVVYATDATIVGHRFVPSSELREALSGQTASEISDLRAAENASDRRFGKLLEVYTPLRFARDRRVAGAFELYLPYLPIQAAIGRDTTRLYLILAAGLLLLYVALFRIVAGASARLRRQAAENRHLALHDPLTGLPNRSFFQDRAAQALRLAEREEAAMAILLLDLDRFKEVNDTLGHHNGDILLQEIGMRLQREVRESDSVARLGGDEFGILLPRIREEEDGIAVAEKIRQRLQKPLVLEGIAIDLDASIGVAAYPAHGSDIETLLQRADVAMYLAKSDRSGCELYSPTRDEYSPARLALAGDLRRAIDQKELILHYQPKADLADGRVTGVEALVRWQHHRQGLIRPDTFIPLAERTGLIRDLTTAVLGAALTQLRDWRDHGLELDVSVNVSARDLLDLELPETVARLLAEHELPAERLELEITESVILADPMRARAVLSRLAAMGVQLAIDDYGSGYSSLAYLKRLPVGEIKIDRSFVMNMHKDPNDAVIVRSTIDLGRNLGLTVVAEGIETEEAWRTLALLGCDQGQGFYLSRPVPADELEQWLRERRMDGRTSSPSAERRLSAER